MLIVCPSVRLFLTSRSTRRTRTAASSSCSPSRSASSPCTSEPVCCCTPRRKLSRNSTRPTNSTKPWAGWLSPQVLLPPLPPRPLRLRPRSRLKWACTGVLTCLCGWEVGTLATRRRWRTCPRGSSRAWTSTMWASRSASMTCPAQRSRNSAPSSVSQRRRRQRQQRQRLQQQKGNEHPSSTSSREFVHSSLTHLLCCLLVVFLVSLQRAAITSKICCSEHWVLSTCW